MVTNATSSLTLLLSLRRSFRLPRNHTIVNGYTVGENAYYAAMRDKSPSAGWVTHHRMTVELMQKYLDEYLKQGYKLTHISSYKLNSKECFAAIWEKNNNNIAWLSYANMTSAKYQSRFNKYFKDGYCLIDVDGYQVGDHVYYAAIWDKSASGAWVAKHRLDSSSFQEAFNEYKKEGYVLRAFSGYNSGEEDRYAGL